jgi:hypothetical protein
MDVVEESVFCLPNWATGPGALKHLERKHYDPTYTTLTIS